MAEHQTTWGSMIWGAVKTVGLVVGAALVLPPVMTNLGTLVTSIGGETATAIGGALTSGGTGLAGLTSQVASTVVSGTALPTTFEGLKNLGVAAGSGIAAAGTSAANYVAANPGTVAGIGAAGLAVGYMLRSAETPARRPVMGAHTARIQQQQMAALAVTRGHA